MPLPCLASMLILKLPLLVPDYKEKRTVLQYALERYTNIDQGQDVPESVIEAFVVKIVVSKYGFDWYLRFDGDPDKPLHCQLQGKRKTNTKIMFSGDISPPAMDCSPTGYHQRLRETGFPPFLDISVQHPQWLSPLGVFRDYEEKSVNKILL